MIDGISETGYAAEKAAGQGRMQVGLGVGRTSPVGTGRPVAGLSANATTVCERSLATYRKPSAMAKWRGHDPPVGTSPTRTGRPDAVSNTAIVSGPRLAT